MTAWNKILTADELAAYHASTAKLDPAFATRQRVFYESRSAAQLATLASQAWLCNESTSYQLARSYAALIA